MRWWPKVTGCATCRCVNPGMTSAAWRSAWSRKARSSSATRARSVSISSRSHRRTSVATWSLRERAVCRRLPASPTSAVRRRSMLRCTSSAATDQRKRPDAISRSIRARPRSIAARSRRLMMRCAASMRAWAREPAMSYLARRRSNETDAVKRLTRSSTGSEKRADQGERFLLVGIRIRVKTRGEDPYVSMASIRQSADRDVLPDFRNLGVIARLLIAVNAAVFADVLLDAPDFTQALDRFAQSAAFVEPLLLVILIVLYAISPPLRRLPYWTGCVSLVALVLVVVAAYVVGLGMASVLPRLLLVALLVIAALLAYLRLLTKAHSPALAEARLQALQARIRPHFLFNSLNAVLVLIRRDPPRAERALEDLADLFRTLMSDARQFVRLADEIALLERYADLEHMRLGERLRITWELDGAPEDALLPPLVLQPLLENAVYHGVEPGTGPGEVAVRIERRGARVLARIENPYLEAEMQRAGNRMALDNIRERLQLFFDAEA